MGKKKTLAGFAHHQFITLSISKPSLSHYVVALPSGRGEASPRRSDLFILFEVYWRLAFKTWLCFHQQAWFFSDCSFQHHINASLDLCHFSSFPTSPLGDSHAIISVSAGSLPDHFKSDCGADTLPSSRRAWPPVSSPSTNHHLSKHVMSLWWFYCPCSTSPQPVVINTSVSCLIFMIALQAASRRAANKKCEKLRNAIPARHLKMLIVLLFFFFDWRIHCHHPATNWTWRHSLIRNPDTLILFNLIYFKQSLFFLSKGNKASRATPEVAWRRLKVWYQVFQ